MPFWVLLEAKVSAPACPHSCYILKTGKYTLTADRESTHFIFLLILSVGTDYLLKRQRRGGEEDRGQENGDLGRMK